MEINFHSNNIAYVTDPWDPSYQIHLLAELAKEYFISILLVWLLVELIFFVALRYSLLPRLNPLNDPLPYEIEPLELIDKILQEVDKLKSYSMDDFISGFFLKARKDDIHEGNARSFLAWVMFGIQEHKLNSEQLHLIDVAYVRVHKKFQNHMPPGYNPNTRHVSISWDNVSYIHRPLLLYVISNLIDLVITRILFRLKRFQLYQVNGMKYWYHAGNSQLLPPIVFFHGITPGWIAYIYFLKNIYGSRPIFLIELDAIKIKSMSLYMPKPEKFALSVKLMLKRHTYKQASLIGHSFGTITAGWFVKHYPDMVSHITLLDPVALLLCLPDVAFNFLYKSPKTIIEWIINFFASNEVTISHTLRRNFFWYRNVLWLEDIPKHVGVIIGVGECDEILHSKAVHEYCLNHQNVMERNNIHVLNWPNFSHGQILFSKDEQLNLFSILTRNEEMKK